MTMLLTGSVLYGYYCFTGFIIKWNVPMCPNTAQIRSFQFYIYDEALSSVPSTENWVEIGEVKALSLPMACSFSLVSI